MGSGWRAVYEAARGRWPRVEASFDVFASHAQSLGLEEVPPNAEWLFLCAACLNGDPAAQTELDREHLPHVRGAIARIDARPEFIAEILQRLREALLVPPDLKLAKYTGRGAFEGWLRVVAAREALDHVRRERGVNRRTKRTGANLNILAAASASKPENDLARREHGPAFQRILAEVLSELSVRDRGLLRLHFVQSCSIDAIGRMYGVHRATAARWIVRTRKLVASRVKKRLQQELGEKNEGDITSMIAALRSDMGLSITGLLGPEPSGTKDDPASG